MTCNHRTTRARLLPTFGLLGLALVLGAGCSSGKGHVEGKVRYKGQDVNGGTLVFVGPDGKQHLAPVLPNGTYRFESPFNGEAKVLYRAPEMRLAAAGKAPPGLRLPEGGYAGQSAPVSNKALKKYGSQATTDLTVTLTNSKQDCTFELTDPVK